MSFNQYTVMGRLTRDPEHRVTANGTDVCNFAIAVDRRMNRDETDFFDVTAFGKLAGVIRDHFHKGKPILLSGEIRQERWTKDGQNRSKVVLIANTFSFVGDRNDTRSDSRDDYQYGDREPVTRSSPHDNRPTTRGKAEPDDADTHAALDDSDIPFSPDFPEDFN